MIRGNITLLDRFGVPVTFEVEASTPKDFNTAKIIKQKQMGEFGYTPVNIPSGGIILPWGNHEDFDWRALGATPGVKRVFDAEKEQMVEIPVVWYRGEAYTRREMVGKKAPGGAPMPDQISYSRGARATEEDAEKAQGGNDAGNKGYIVLVAFRKMKGKPDDYKYPEFDAGNADTAIRNRTNNNQSGGQSAPTVKKEQRSYLQLKNLIVSKLKAKNPDAEPAEETIHKNVIARAKRELNKEIDSVFKLSPAENYKLFISFGGSPDDDSVPPVEPKPAPVEPKPAAKAAPQKASTPEEKAPPSQKKAAAPKAAPVAEPAPELEPEESNYFSEPDVDAPDEDDFPDLNDMTEDEFIEPEQKHIEPEPANIEPDVDELDDDDLLG